MDPTTVGLLRCDVLNGILDEIENMGFDPQTEETLKWAILRLMEQYNCARKGA